MTINRRAPRKADNYTITDNDTTFDDEISYRALGLLHFVLAKPLTWRARSEDLSLGPGREGRQAVRTAMRELERHGYLVREKVQNEKGQWSTDNVWHEIPVPPEQRTHSGKPLVAPETRKPHVGSPHVGSPGAIERTGRKDGKKGKNSRPPVEDVTSLAAREAPRGGRTTQLDSILDPAGELGPPPPEHTEPTPDHPGGTSHSAEAHRIAAHWGRMQKQTPPGTLLAAVARSVQGCLDSGYLPPQIAAGLDAWDASTVAAASQIPAFVHKAVNGRTPVRDGFNHFGDTSRDGFSPSTADLRAAQAQALKRRPSTSAWPITPLELT